MNVLCCFREEESILLGIPNTAEWSIKATPNGGGSVLTLQLNGDKDILLFSGNPVNLSGHTIEIKDFSTACTDVSESALNVNITYPHDGIRYYEAVTLPGGEAETKTISEDGQKPYTDRTAHYKWSLILKYLEDRLGTVTVES